MQVSVSETVTDVVQLPMGTELNIDRGFAGGARVASDPQHLRSDLKLAIAVQRQMLQRNTKQLATIRYAGLSTAARGIGGDYYDFLDLGTGRPGFLLADVSGKGVGSGALDGKSAGLHSLRVRARVQRPECDTSACQPAFLEIDTA